MKRSDKSLILLAVGLIAVAAVYFLVFTKLNEQTEQMNKDNAKLEKQVEYLQELADNKQKYLDDTASMSAEIENIKAQFPAQYLEEDDILYVIGVEKQYDVTVESLKMSKTTLIDVAKPKQEEEAEEEATEEEAAEGEEEAEEVSTETSAAPEIQLYRTPLTASMVTSYNSIKDIIKKINTDKDRKSIDTISLAFDSESGELRGVLGFSMYSLTGTEAEYKTPKITGVTYGTNDIFNSVQRKREVEAARAATE